MGNPYGFTGRRLDEETGLYYYRARYYSPKLGRFLQTDPLGYYDSTNLYQYCLNNPVNYLDPWGLNFWTLYDSKFTTHIGAIVGSGNSFMYYSFQPKGLAKPSGEGYLEKREFKSLKAAMKFAKQQKYEQFIEYETPKCDDERAKKAAERFIQEDDYYEVLLHNCCSLVDYMANSTVTLSGLWMGYRAPFWAFGLNRSNPYLIKQGTIR